MLNKIILAGRLTRDIELRHTTSGVAVASFTLAVDRDFKPKDGGDRQTDFIDVTAWRGVAEAAAEHLSKGRMAAVTGRLQIKEWTDKEGNKRRSPEVAAEAVYYLGGAADAGKRREDSAAEPRDYGEWRAQNPRGQKSTAARDAGYSTAASAFSELEDDADAGDLPF